MLLLLFQEKNSDIFKDMRDRASPREATLNSHPYYNADPRMVSPMPPPHPHHGYHPRHHGHTPPGHPPQPYHHNFMGQIYDPYNPYPHTPPKHHYSPYGYGHGHAKRHSHYDDSMSTSVSSYSSSSSNAKRLRLKDDIELEANDDISIGDLEKVEMNGLFDDEVDESDTVSNVDNV